MRTDELEEAGGLDPAELSAARAVWSRLRVDPRQHDFTRIDRAILRVAADERLRSAESGHLRRVLWPGFALAGALAALGVALVLAFGTSRDAAGGSAAGVASVVDPGGPREVGAGARFGGEQADTVRVGRSTVRSEAGAALRVVEASEAHTLVALDRGAASFEVGKRQSGAEYVVESGRVTVTVVGTAFRVSRALEGGVQVMVEHGLVRVARDGEELALLRAGESLDVPAEEPAPVDTPELAGGDLRPPSGPGGAAELLAVPGSDGGQDNTALEAPTPDAEPAQGAPTGASDDTPVEAIHAVPTPPVQASKVVRVAHPVQRPTSLQATPPAAKAPATPAVKAPAVAPVAKAPAAPAAVKVEPVVVVQPFVQPHDPASDAATEELRDIVQGLSPAACGVRLGDLRAWVKDHPRHPRRKTARHALAYCLYHTDHRAEADRLFGQLGLRIKDILNPQPPHL